MKKILALADLYLTHLPEERMRLWCPEDYPYEICDDHKLTCWNHVVDSLSAFPEEEISRLYFRYVQNKEDMKPWVEEGLRLEDDIMNALLFPLETILPIRKGAYACPSKNDLN